MNPALTYLWFSLLRRKALSYAHSLRKPLSLLGFLAVISLLAFLFYFHKHHLVGQLVRRENLIGAALVMLWGSVFKGFLQRGFACEPADIDFLFTSPFTQREVLLYRLLPNYVFAVFQSLIFLTLFASHFSHPVITALCLTLFQIVCFHLASAAAIFGGAISEQAHYRLRWIMLGVAFGIAAFYLRVAWDFRIVPSFCSSPVFALLFYPAVSLPELANAMPVHRWALQFRVGGPVHLAVLWQNCLYLGGFAVAALASLWWLFQFKANIFESALDATSRLSHKRQRLREGLRTAVTDQAAPSVALPKWRVFSGVGAIVWKNLVAARRSRREMLIVSFFVLTYAGFFTALLWIYRDLSAKAGGAPLGEARGFTTGIAVFLGMLVFFLQRMFPFDFRRDGPQLVAFRTLPFSPFALAVAEIAVPTLFCLAAQACGVIPLLLLGKLDSPTLLFVVLGYPAIALALNSVWNLHYLLAATRRRQGRPESPSAVGLVVVVALSFLVFYPAGWTTFKVANHFTTGGDQSVGFALAAAAGLAVQAAVDLLLIMALAKYFQRFEISRDL
jgi:hypothetical protein